MKILLDFDDVLNLSVNWTCARDQKPIPHSKKFLRRSGWDPYAYEYHVYKEDSMELFLTTNREMLDRIADLHKRSRGFVWLTDWLKTHRTGITPIEDVNTLPVHLQKRHEFLTGIVGPHMPVHGGVGSGPYYMDNWWKCDAVSEAVKHDDIIWVDDKLSQGFHNAFAKKFDNLHMIKVVESLGLTKTQFERIEELVNAR